jgi:hypothetical protein
MELHYAKGLGIRGFHIEDINAPGQFNIISTAI